MNDTTASADPASPASDLFTDADLIHSYTRAQALADGALVDVTDVAREFGVLFPVAMTRAAFTACVTWTRTDVFQQERGRLLDVCAMLAMALRVAKVRAETSRMAFGVMRIPNEGTGDEPEPMRLDVVCGPGDDMEPVLTVMLPEED